MLYIEVILIASVIHQVNSLIGFDCAGQHINATTISLLSTGACDLNVTEPTKQPVYMQLLQLAEFNEATVMQCKVEIQRTAYYCGMHSHVSAVKNGEAAYISESLYDRCKRMHEDGVLHLGFGEDSLITGLKTNQTKHYSVLLAGTLDDEGRCKGARYQDGYGSWDNVVVQAVATVTLQSGRVPVNLNTGKIYLRSGTTCELGRGFCFDLEDGYSFWQVIPTTTCDFHKYDVLYEGPGIKMKDETRPQASVYSLVSDDITFALSTSRSKQVCGYDIRITEHPKLFIVETTKENVPKAKGDVPVENLDIFTYVNSKFVYVERHIRDQMTALYYNIMKQRCELEAEVLRNTLSLATLLPDEFAYRIMKGPGYMAVTAGEAIHVVKCIPVEVRVRQTKECYQELPVTVRNASLFLTPKSHILTKFGMVRECSHELPTLYRIEDTWAQFLPDGHVYPVPPQELQPLTRIDWKYITPGPLADSGVYSSQDINKLRDHIMFPAERPALLNSIARGVGGYPRGTSGVSFHHLIDEEALEQIAQGAAAKLWGGFVSFGTATAGIIGIFIIVRIIKIVVDTTIHGYALHTVYGCGLQLLGAVWSSLTHLLLHLAHPPPDRKNNQGNKKDPADAKDKDNDSHCMEMKPSTSSAPPKNNADHDETGVTLVYQPRSAKTTGLATTATPEVYSARYVPSAGFVELNKRLDELERMHP